MGNTYYLNKPVDLHHLQLLQIGEEIGFNHFYRKLYSKLSHTTTKRLKDDLAASCIVQDAFLMLWMLREKIVDTPKLVSFLTKQLNDGCSMFYRRSLSVYHTLIRLDDIKNYQQFMLPVYDKEEDETFTETDDGLSPEQLNQWAELTQAVQYLPENNQMFIKLCLQYSFNYAQIGRRLGGVPEYLIAREVDTSIQYLKNLLVESKKLSNSKALHLLQFEGELSQAQRTIFHMRYELKMCFEAIARKLRVEQKEVQRKFIQAMKVVKAGNK